MRRGGAAERFGTRVYARRPLTPRSRKESALYEFLGREADVLRDLSEQDGGEVAALMHRHGGPATVRVPELHVRAALAHVHEA